MHCGKRDDRGDDLPGEGAGKTPQIVSVSWEWRDGACVGVGTPTAALCFLRLSVPGHSSLSTGPPGQTCHPTPHCMRWSQSNLRTWGWELTS